MSNYTCGIYHKDIHNERFMQKWMDFIPVLFIIAKTNLNVEE